MWEAWVQSQGRSAAEGKGYPLQFSGVTKSQTQLNDFHFQEPWKISQVVLVVKNPPAIAGHIRDLGLICGSGSSPGRGCGSPLQYSCLENSMDRGIWQATVHRVTKSQTQLEWLSIHTKELPSEKWTSCKLYLSAPQPFFMCFLLIFWLPDLFHFILITWITPYLTQWN